MLRACLQLALFRGAGRAQILQGGLSHREGEGGRSPLLDLGGGEKKQNFPCLVGRLPGRVSVYSSISLPATLPSTADSVRACSVRGYLPAPPTPGPKYNYELTGMMSASGALSQEPAVL